MHRDTSTTGRIGEAHSADVLQPKVVTAGTHRVCTPEQTWSRIVPLLPRAGITRLADVTWLDDIGIPVYQAIRPKSRSLSVSQGKGITAELAKVSAVMESIESWSAEHVPASVQQAQAHSLALPYDVGALARQGYASLARTIRLDWCAARDLCTGVTTHVPIGVVSLDWQLEDTWSVAPFFSDSNGLASGNTIEEATLHGLCELLEREALATNDRWRIDAQSITGEYAKSLLQLLIDAGNDIEVDWLRNEFGIPAFAATLQTDSFPVPCLGYGAHLDADVALCRALSEAAQSRATVISGARDDVSAAVYEWHGAGRGQPVQAAATFADVVDVGRQAQLVASSDVATDLATLVGTLPPSIAPLLMVDLSPAVDVHVVKVIAVGMHKQRGHA